MNLFKKLLVIIMVISIAVPSTLSAYGETVKSVGDQADILNELGILRGDGTGYNLENQLKRSEVATFIVRLIGKEAEVISNKAQYSKVDFSDVNEEDWFAPYVGYCTEVGIVAGYLDNTFRPNDYVSEKAFLKLALTAMGYVYDVDFNWNNVYASAYSVGLVTDSKYQTLVDDNPEFTRGDVVEGLYQALRTPHKTTHERMVQYFIKASLISKEEGIEYGLIEDDVDTDVTTMVATDHKVLYVEFNEAILELDARSIVIYEKDNPINTLTIESIDKVEDKNGYVITFVEEQILDQDYSVNIFNIIDAYGNKTLSLEKEFTGYRPDELVSDFFLISKVDVISYNVIHLYYTQPINDNALQASLYALKMGNQVLAEGNSTNLQISKLTDSDYGISIYFKNITLNAEGTYELTVNANTTSQYGVKLKGGVDDSIKFNGTDAENSPLELIGIGTPNTNTIELAFNQPVNEVLAKQVYNYYITDQSNNAIQITESVVINGSSVRLTVNKTLINKESYTIMINNLNDSSRQFSITEKAYEFDAAIATTSNIKINGIVPYDAITIDVYLSKSLDEQSAIDISSYKLYGKTSYNYIGTPSAVYYNKKENDKLVRLYFPSTKKLVKNSEYELQLMQTLKDELGNAQKTIEKVAFTYSGTSVVDTYIAEATVIGDNTIRLSFNKEIALNIPNILNTNYTLSYEENGNTFTKIPLSANYINPETLVLTFDILEPETVYNITFDKLLDYGGAETINKSKYFASVWYE